MAVKVSVPVLYDDNGQFLDGQLFAIGTDAVVYGEVSKPNGYSVPPYPPTEMITTVQVKDTELGTLFLKLTLAEYRTIVGDATDNGGGGGPSGPVEWDDIENTPTTLNGYGITDPVELTTRKAIDFTVVNNTLYPSVAAVDTFVRNMIATQDPADPADYVTDGALPGSPTYNNGASGVGATLTAGVNGALIIGGEELPNGVRVLVKDQATLQNNGIYLLEQGDVSNPWVLTRATDYDTPTEINSNKVVPVIQGQSLWLMVTNVLTIGTTPIWYEPLTIPPDSIALKSDPLSQFASTTSAQLAGVISDETGFSGAAVLVFNINPIINGLTLSDASNIVGNAGTGNKIGTTSAQKFGFFGATPVAQQTGNILTALTNLGFVVSPSLSAGDIPDLSATYAVKSGTLAQFASTTSAQLSGVISDETGYTIGALLVFNINPTIQGMTLGDGTNIVGNSTNGNKIGTNSLEKWAFYGATPIVRPSGNILTALSNLGLVSTPSLSAGDIPDLSATYAVKAGTLAQFASTTSAQLAGVISDETGTGLLVFATNPTLTGATIADASNIALGTGTGTQIGTAANQKVGFFGTAPVAQQTGDVLTGLAALGLIATPTLTGYGALNTVNTWTKAQRGNMISLTYASTITPDFSLGNNFEVQLAGNPTIAMPTNLSPNQSGVFYIWQGSTGSNTVAWAWPFLAVNGVFPVLQTGKFLLDEIPYFVIRATSSTVTISNASPAVITWNAHGLISGMRIQLTTTGALPTGLTVNTTYWVNVTGANTFNVSSSEANLQAGTFINTSSAGSGTHTANCSMIRIGQNPDIS